MVRVCKNNQNSVIITHGTPEKRMHIFDSYDCRKNVDIYAKKLKLSDLAQLINLLRSDLKDKPLSHALKDKEYMKNAIKELMLIKKEEELLNSTNAKHKMIGLMLKARRVKAEEQKNSELKKEIKEKSEGSKVPIDYAPQRQDHCYIYVFRKKI